MVVLFSVPTAFLFIVLTVMLTPFGAIPHRRFQNLRNLLHHVNRDVAERSIFSIRLVCAGVFSWYALICKKFAMTMEEVTINPRARCFATKSYTKLCMRNSSTTMRSGWLLLAQLC